MTRRVPRVMLAVAAMMLLASCGPEKKVTLGVRDISTDILLSGAKPPAPPSLPDPPLPTPPGFPFVPTPVNTGVDSDGGVFIPLPPKPSPTKAPPPVRCPKAPEYVAPRHEATLRPTGKPIAATYDVRVDGEFAIDGEHKATGVYPPAGTRTIGEVADLPGGAGWSYSIADETGLVTSYQVIPKPVGDEAVSNVDSANQPVPTQPGIYISKFSYKRTDGTTLTLDPEPSVMVAKLPFAQGERWTSRGFDAATGISVVVNGQTGLGVEYRPARARVDACGTVLDAFWVEYTIDTTPIADAVANNEPPSQLEGPELLVKFVGSQVAFATQFGGIPIEEIYKLDGTDKTETLQITRHSVYSREPALPEAT